MEIVTVGHSTRAWPEFLGILRAHGVGIVADVRTAPRSRRAPWASIDALAPLLAGAGIGYAHLGRELGGLREGGLAAYAAHMGTPIFEAGVERLLDLAREARVAVMCAEARPFDGHEVACHRALIADALVERGISVVHASSVDDAIPHRARGTRQARLG